jgi:organic hydroperoxide reductase OsmC/OhrA
MKSRLHLHTTAGGETRVGTSAELSLALDGSSDVSGRLLCLAAAGCYANTLLAEAMRRGIWVRCIDVDAELEWFEDSQRAVELTLTVRVEAEANEDSIMELAEHADRTGRVASALRFGVAVRVAHAVARPCRVDWNADVGF